MKALTTILLAVLMSMGAWGESCNKFYDTGELKESHITEESPDEEGWYSGVWKSFLKNGELKSQGKYLYKNNFKKAYYETGELNVEAYGVDCLNEGSYKKYYKNGNIKSEGVFKKDKTIGLWKLYFENGILSREGNYVDKQRDGFWTNYYENGSIYAEGNYLLGKIEGRVKTYHRNGALCSNNLYENGKLIGSAKKFYNNGQIEYEQAYVDGKKHGLGVRVDSDGTYLWVAKYENGKWLDKESRAKNTFLFRKMKFTEPQCGRHLEPINAPKIKITEFIQDGGCVVLDFIINQEGMTEDIKVRNSVFPSRVYKNSFENNGKKFIKKLEYPIPRNKEGNPVSMKAAYKILFNAMGKKKNYVFPGCE